MRERVLIIYNRVPKCGSTTMGFLLDVLKKPTKHYYKVENQIKPGQKHGFKTLQEENSWLSDIQNHSKPTVIVRHQFYTEIRKEIVPEKKILWINLVRDPVDQFISGYYYMRHGFLKNVNKTKTDDYKKNRLSHIDLVTQNMTVDECIKNGIKACVEPKTSYLQYKTV